MKTKIINYILFFVSALLFILISFVFETDLGSGKKELENIIILALPCFVLYAYSFNLKFEERNNIFKLYFIAYILVLMNFVFSNNRSNLFTFNNVISYEFNLVPFSSIVSMLKFDVSFGLYNIIGNFLMLSPLALLFPILNEKFNKNINYIILVFLISFCLEITQFCFNIGSFDIDDIILNTSGAIIFYFIFKTNLIKKYIKFLFFDISLKKNINNFLYCFFLILTSLTIFYNIYRITFYIYENTINIEELKCKDDSFTYIGDFNNYHIFSNCNYTGYIRFGNERISISDYVKYHYNQKYDKLLGLTKKEIITNAIVNFANKNSKKLVYNGVKKDAGNIYYYGIDSIFIEKDGVFYNLENDLNNNKIINYKSIVSGSLDKRREKKYTYFIGKYYNILNCYYDSFKFNSYILPVNTKISDKSCINYENLPLEKNGA